MNEQAPKKAASSVMWHWPFASGIAVLAGSLLHYLSFQQYPLFTAEIAIILGALILVAGAATLLYQFAPRVIRALMTGLLAYLAIDLNLDIGWWGIGAATAVALIALAKGEEPLRFLTIIFAVIGFWALAGLAESRPFFRTPDPLPATDGVSAAPIDAPAIIHLILDEHGGGADLARLSKHVPGLDRRIMGTYRDMGFDVWPAAYSSDFNTMFAIPDMYGEAPGAEGEALESGRTPRRLELLADLRQRGYAIDIWQTDYLDMCAKTPADRCQSYWSFSLSALAVSSLPPEQRSALIAYNFLRKATLGRLAMGLGARIGNKVGRARWLTRPVAEEHRLSTLAALNIWDRVDARLASLRPGEAVIAHILFPHYPYAAMPGCSLLPPGRWLERVHGGTIPERARAYAAQLDCTTQRVARTIAAIERSEARDNYILVIHGDHGSRLMNRFNFNDPDAAVSDDELLASFSTLFAVRQSDERGRCIAAQASVADLLRQLYGGEALPEERAEVSLGDRRKTTPRIKALPDWPARCDDNQAAAVVESLGEAAGENDQ